MRGLCLHRLEFLLRTFSFKATWLATLCWDSTGSANGLLLNHQRGKISVTRRTLLFSGQKVPNFLANSLTICKGGELVSDVLGQLRHRDINEIMVMKVETEEDGVVA
jgi:hypothetical protein